MNESEAYEREIERRFAELDYPPHLKKIKPEHDCGGPCHCDHYEEPGIDDEPES